MSSTGSVTKLIRRVKEGDAAAARALLARYLPRLLGLARTQLRGRNLRAADEEDVVQSALLGFFLGAERGQYTQCHDRDDLWHLLVKIIVRKAKKLLKHEDAQKRHCRKAEEESWPPGCRARLAAEPSVEQLADPNPPPDLEALAGEQVERLLARLGDKELIAIAVWKWEGRSNEEMGALLGCTARTIQRKLQLIRTIWREEEAEP